MALSKGHTFTSGEVVTPTKLNNLVDNATIGDGTITTAMMADDAITSDKMADDAITSDKIVDDAITSDKIVDDAITSDKIADDAITSDKIADGSVTSSHLASGAGGGVTSVTAGNGLDGGEITSSGTIAIPTSGGTLNIDSDKVGIGGDAHSHSSLKVTGDVLINEASGDTQLHILNDSTTTACSLKLEAGLPFISFKDKNAAANSQIYNMGSTDGKIQLISYNDDDSLKNTLFSFYSDGNVKLDSLPTTDPSTAGYLWNDGGVVSVSGSSGYSGAGDTLTLGTKQTFTTTGAASDAEFTGIPSGVKQVNIMVSNIKQNHTAESALTMQIGDSGGYETSGYVVRPTATMNSANIGTRWELASAISSSDTGIHGIATMYRIDDYTWVYSSGMCRGNTTVGLSGSKTLSGTLDRIKFIFDYTVNSTSDPGYINISYI